MSDLQKKINLILCFALLQGYLLAQNLVPNPGFETGPCPVNITHFGVNLYPVGWIEFPKGPTFKTTSDYFKTGCFDGSTYLAGTVVGEPPPHTGNAWMGAFAYLSQSNCAYGWAEGSKRALSTSLVPGTNYKVSVWLKEFVGTIHNNGVKNSTDGIGIWLWGATPPTIDYCTTLYTGMEISASSPPQFLIPSDTIPGTWTKFSFDYSPTATIDSIGVATWNPSYSIQAYYNYDNVSIIEEAPCPTCTLSGAGSVWTWTGCLNTDWFEPCNWDRQSIPTTTSSVVIPQTTNDPIINSGVGNCYDITIHDNAEVTIEVVNGALLNVIMP